MKTFRTATAVLVACLALSACGGQDGGGTAPTPSPSGGAPVTTPPTPADPADPTAPLPPTAVPTKPPRNPGTPPPAMPGATTLTGTVTPGVEPNCLLLDGHLLVGGPRDVVKSGARITVTGRADPGMLTTCQQGIPFVVESARPA